MPLPAPHSITRRALLGGLLAAPAHRALASGGAQAFDVAIIGAGAAGISAARSLVAAGRNVVVLEASGRIGGRALTDTQSFDAPFDLGCAWLHAADRNPLVPLARKLGFRPELHQPDEVLFAGNRRASPGEVASFEATRQALHAAVATAGAAGRDVSVASVSPRQMPWIASAENWLGPLDMGQEVDNVSCLDWWQMADTDPDMLVAKGLGTLVARLGRRLPVRLNMPVHKVDWSGPGVVVATPAGDLHAGAVIVTASTGVLASGAIGFTPALPDWKQRAFDALPMGLLCKLALQFGGDHFGIARDTWLVRDGAGGAAAAPDQHAMAFLCWPRGSDMIIGFAGGDLAWELEGAGLQEAQAYALAQLGEMLGSGVRRDFRHASLTGWGRNRWSMGAYSAALPGSAGARDLAARPVGRRVFFAGEAMGGAHAQTCGGAWLSGAVAARQAMRALGG